MQQVPGNRPEIALRHCRLLPLPLYPDGFKADGGDALDEVDDFLFVVGDAEGIEVVAGDTFILADLAVAGEDFFVGGIRGGDVLVEYPFDGALVAEPVIKGLGWYALKGPSRPRR